MKLSTRGRYAVMAMTDLAQHYYADKARDASALSKPVALTMVAERQQISLPYLEQIFQDLRKFGLVESVRGAHGGFRLSRSPQEIWIGDIISSVEEVVDITRCQTSDGCLKGHARCLTHDLWADLSNQIDGFLNSVSLNDVISGNTGKPTSGSTQVSAHPS